VGKLRRNYSISCAPNDRAYRITVKRESTPGQPLGQASNWLHDQAGPGTVLHVAAPAGDFFLDTADTNPVVLVSAGVGLTPMVSMLEAIVADDANREVRWVHGTLNGRVHAMRDHVRRLVEVRAEQAIARTFYQAPLPTDRPGIDYDGTGLISAEWLVANSPADTATYYLCGPKPFLRSLVAGLSRQGIPLERIRYEFFGPADEILGSGNEQLAA
jgi:nitric oxide dioxygenase